MLKLKSIVAQAAGVVRKIAEVVAKAADFAKKAMQPVVCCAAAQARPRCVLVAAPKIRILTGIFAVALLSGCASKQWDALMVLAPKEGGQAVHAAVKVPAAMTEGSSNIVIEVDGDVYKGKMICTKEGFTTESSSFAIGSGGSFAGGGGSGTTTARLSDCQATLISGDKSIQCQVSGTHEDVTNTGKEVARNLLYLPTLGLSRVVLSTDYAPIGNGECRKSDGTIYAMQIAELPEEE